MFFPEQSILGQEETDLGSLVWVLVVVVLPLLSTLGAKLRKRFGRQEGASDGVLTPLPRTARGVRPASGDVGPTRRPGSAPRIPAPQGERRGSPRPVMKGPPKAVPIPVQRNVLIELPPSPQMQAKPVRRAGPAREVRGKKGQHRRPAAVHTEERRERASTIQRLMRETAEARSQPGKEKLVARRILPKKLRAADMRSAVVLSEILQPPLALREGWGGVGR